MKKITLLFILLSLVSFSQNKSSDDELILINEKIDSLKLSKNNIEKGILALKEITNKRSDSLEKELLFYRTKEDYYSTALSDQGNRFTLIISGIMALFALISFGAFKYEVSLLRNETNYKLKKHKKEIKKYKDQLKNTNSELVAAKGNLNTSIAVHFEKEENYPQSFNFYLAAALNHAQSESKKDEKDTDEIFKVCIINLECALVNLNKITSDDDKDLLKTIIDLCKITMDDISEFDDDKVKNLIAQIRLKSSSILE